jgi:hypothetical protein
MLYDDGSVAASSGVTLAGAGASLDISGATGGRTIQDLERRRRFDRLAGAATA